MMVAFENVHEQSPTEEDAGITADA